MNNEAIATILSALAGNGNVARLATPRANPSAETVKNLTAAAERCVSHAIISTYMTDDQKNTVNRIAGAANYLGDSLTYQQADKIVKDLNKTLNDVEQNIMNDLAQVLQAAGIRM